MWMIWLSGFLWTAVGTWLVTISAGGHLDGVFRVYWSANVILASGALFLLLCTKPTSQLENRFPRAYRLLRRVSQYCLAIYLLHLMVLEGFQKGLFGFKLSITTLNPILEIPLISLVTLAICLGVVWLLSAR
jgi:surface polysaccharide O-acyltransferase-like enzyme